MEEQVAAELGKAAGEILKDTSKGLIGFLKAVFGPAVSEFGLGLGDQTKAWRNGNMVEILAKAQIQVEKRGLTPEAVRSLPFGEALRAFESASMEDDDDIQSLWARLLANAIDPNRSTPIKKVYVELLRLMPPAGAALLDLLWECESRNRFENADQVAAFNNDMNALADERWRTFPEEQRQVVIQELVRMRCIAYRPSALQLDNMFATLPDELGGSSPFARSGRLLTLRSSINSLSTSIC